jgi:hypothetical protein
MSRRARGIVRGLQGDADRVLQKWGLRVGKVSATNTGGTPKTVTVHGIEMRYLASYASPTTNDIVVWAKFGSTNVVLGELA